MLGAAATVAALSPSPPSARAGTSAGGLAATDTAVVEAGRGLYTANCAACHGAGGAGRVGARA